MLLAARVVLTCCVFAAAETQLPITFANRQPFPVDLLWADGVNDPVLMSSIDPGEEISMNSYAGHQFLFAHPGSTEPLMKHTIDAEQSVYELPAEAKIPAPPVPPKPRSLLPEYTLEELAELRETERAQTEQLVETFAKVVPAKFRNLSGRKIDLWRDSGSTGVKQGVVAPGADLTTSSYPGCGLFSAAKHAAARSHASPLRAQARFLLRRGGRSARLRAGTCEGDGERGDLPARL